MLPQFLRLDQNLNHNEQQMTGAWNKFKAFCKACRLETNNLYQTLAKKVG